MPKLVFAPKPEYSRHYPGTPLPDRSRGGSDICLLLLPLEQVMQHECLGNPARFSRWGVGDNQLCGISSGAVMGLDPHLPVFTHTSVSGVEQVDSDVVAGGELTGSERVS